MEGSTPAMPAEPGTLKATLPALPGKYVVFVVLCPIKLMLDHFIFVNIIVKLGRGKVC
jgi:hypothetical protein